MSAAILPGTVSRIARTVVLAVLLTGALAACGSQSSDLCKQAATQQRLGELDMAAVSYARAERANPHGCGKEGLQEVAQDQAAVAVAVARGQAAEKAQDNDEAIASYARALRLDVREGRALYALRRLVRTTTDVGENWQVAMALKEQGYTDRARAEVAQVIALHPKEPVPTALATLAPNQAAAAGDASIASNDSTASNDQGAAAQQRDQVLSASTILDEDEGPAFLTLVTWIVLGLLGAAFLTVVVLSRSGTEHVIPRALAGAADLADRFAVRQGVVRAGRATRSPALAGGFFVPPAGPSGAPPSAFGPGAPGAGPPAEGPAGAETDQEGGRTQSGGNPNGHAHGGANGVGGATADDTPLARTRTADVPDPEAEPEPVGDPLDLLTPAESAVVSGSLVAAEVGDPSASSYTPAAVEAPLAADGARTALARSAHPSRWKLHGVLKRRGLPQPPDPQELEPHLLGDPAGAPGIPEPGSSTGSVVTAASGADARQPSRDELLSRVVVLERRHQAQQNDVVRLSAREDAEVTSVFVTSSRSPWQAARAGDEVPLVVVDTRVYWSGEGRDTDTPGTLVVRQATSPVDDARRGELLDLAVPAPLDDATWQVGRLTALLDDLTAPPGEGRWTGWWESPTPLRFDRAASHQGSITEQWRALVLAEPVPEADGDVELRPLLPLNGDGDVRLRTTARLRDVADDLGPVDGAVLPAGRQFYAVTLVTTADRSVTVAALERSVGRDALSQAISREVLDTLDPDLGVVGTELVDVLASAGRGAARREALHQMLDGVRRELEEAAGAQA